MTDQPSELAMKAIMNVLGAFSEETMAQRKDFLDDILNDALELKDYKNLAKILSMVAEALSQVTPEMARGLMQTVLGKFSITIYKFRLLATRFSTFLK